MAYMNCPRCQLSVRAPAEPGALWENCPRCFGREALVVPVFVTDRLLWPVASSIGGQPTTAAVSTVTYRAHGNHSAGPDPLKR